MTNYTNGNYTISDKVTDTIATKKDISVVDLDWANDFDLVQSNNNTAVYQNITGAGIQPPECVKFAVTDIADCYANLNGLVLPNNKAASTKAVQVMVEVTALYKAENSVSGEVIDLPLKGRVVLRIPTLDIIEQSLIEDFVERVISAAYATGGTNTDRIVSIARGSVEI